MQILRRNESPQATDENVTSLPGCGLAGYAVLLMFLCVVGMAGMAGGFIGVLFQGEGKGPLPLQPGNQTAVWALAPMRESQVIRIDEIPLAYHAERRDATAACALLADRLVRVEAGVGSILTYADIQAVSVEGTEATGVSVTATRKPGTGTPDAITCTFAGNEGGEKFDRQLRSEVDRAARPPE